MLKNALLTVSLCFGVGLGLAPTVRSARACSCIHGVSWSLELVEISGAGDVSDEQLFWREHATLLGGELLGSPPDLFVSENPTKLERVQ